MRLIAGILEEITEMHKSGKKSYPKKKGAVMIMAVSQRVMVVAKGLRGWGHLFGIGLVLPCVGVQRRQRTGGLYQNTFTLITLKQRTSSITCSAVGSGTEVRVKGLVWSL